MPGQIDDVTTERISSFLAAHREPSDDRTGTPQLTSP